MQVPLQVAGEHGGTQAPAREGVTVGLHRRLAAGAAGDVVEGAGLEDRFCAGFPLIRVEREVIGPADIDLGLRRRPKRK